MTPSSAGQPTAAFGSGLRTKHGAAGARCVLLLTRTLLEHSGSQPQGLRGDRRALELLSTLALAAGATRGASGQGVGAGERDALVPGEDGRAQRAE